MTMTGRWRRAFGAAGTLVGLLAVSAMPAAASGPAFAAAGPSAGLEAQIVAAINQDRTAGGLPALTLDPRLSAVAEARARYMVAQGFFSHCSGGESDVRCRHSGYDFLPRDRAAGLGVDVGGTTIAENLALNNYTPDAAPAQTNAAWLNSPEHRATILDSRLTATGVGAVCCFAGTLGGQALSPADHVYIYVQEFAGGPGAVSPGLASTPAAILGSPW
jgi:uncharacterized protein YkwD